MKSTILTTIKTDENLTQKPSFGCFLIQASTKTKRLIKDSISCELSCTNSDRIFRNLRSENVRFLGGCFLFVMKIVV